MEKYKDIAKKWELPYDCVIGVSGGKDSAYQAYIAKEKYGMNPLLATYITFNTGGIENMRT